MTVNNNGPKDFQFPNQISNFLTYNSSRDKTNVNEAAWVRGSYNVYKKINGNIANRPGLKRRGTADDTLAGVNSTYIYNSSWGDIFPLWVANGKLQVEIETATDTYQWVTIATTSQTRWVMDAWWDNTNKKNKVIACNGTSILYSWAGGITQVSSATSSTLTKTGTATWTEDHFETPTSSAAGSSTTQFDITNPSGTTFRYTYDGTGTDPSISATTCPIGSYVYLNAQNFASGNKGVFVVTGSGSNYFEVTNASGVVESNKTIGTGSIYLSFKNLLTINDTTYGYTGGQATTTLTGVLPDPSAITANTYVVSGLIPYPNTPATSYPADFLKVVNNRAFVGSYTSQLVYISSSTDFTNYTIPGSIVPGSPNLLTLDGVGKGITTRQGDALVSFGTNGWVKVTFPTYTNSSGVLLEQITPELLPVQSLGAAYAHEFIDTSGDNVIYLAQDQQVRYLGNTNNSFFTVFPSLSQEIYTELQEEDFTLGQLNCIGDYIYLTSPNAGKTYIYQARQSIDANTNVVAERLWYAPFIWSASRVEEISGRVVVFSSQNPQVYYGWDTDQYFDDSPSDEELPYNSILAFAYREHGDRTRLKEFDKLFTEGYMSTGTELNALINYEYMGSGGQNNQVINSDDLQATFYQTTPQPLGQTPLGSQPLGDAIVQADTTLPKFRNIKSLSLKNCFEYQIIYYSSAVNSQWEIETTATNADFVTKQQITYLINKLTP